MASLHASSEIALDPVTVPPDPVESPDESSAAPVPSASGVVVDEVDEVEAVAVDVRGPEVGVDFDTAGVEASQDITISAMIVSAASARRIRRPDEFGAGGEGCCMCQF